MEERRASRNPPTLHRKDGNGPSDWLIDHYWFRVWLASEITLKTGINCFLDGPRRFAVSKGYSIVRDVPRWTRFTRDRALNGKKKKTYPATRLIGRKMFDLFEIMMLIFTISISDSQPERHENFVGKREPLMTG